MSELADHMETAYREYHVLGENDEDITMNITLTHEGVIVDLFSENSLVGTWGMTAQEILDNFNWK